MAAQWPCRQRGGQNRVFHLMILTGYENITIGHFGINGHVSKTLRLIRTSYFGKANILTPSLPHTEALPEENSILSMS